MTMRVAGRGREHTPANDPWNPPFRPSTLYAMSGGLQDQVSDLLRM